MSPTVRKRYQCEDDCGSDTSTIKGVPLPRRSCSTDSEHSNGTIRYANSAFCIEDENSDEFEANSDELSDEDDELLLQPQPTTRVKQIDKSPEFLQKRKEVYNKWLQSVKEREKEKKRLEQEQREQREQAQLELEEKKAEKELKVQQWMEKKRKQAEEKEVRMNEMKKILDEVSHKPKEFKKAINFQDWISQKNQNFQTEKKRRDQQQNLTKTHQKSRETISAQSYTKWVSTASSKAKPVPMGKGLESLRGCSTKIYMNPEPWNEDWD